MPLIPDIGQLRRKIFGISRDETTCAKRGFSIKSPEKARRLENIGETFVHGYHSALLYGAEALSKALERVEPENRGFAYEGAGMGLALLDFIFPWNHKRLSSFLSLFGASHIYMLHVGAGWAFARTPWLINRRLADLDPLLRWLAFDGYGFHEGYFHWTDSLVGLKVPQKLNAAERHVFDQGLGRSLWFVGGVDVDTVLHYLNKFPDDRQQDLWSGIGLAATYAAGAERSELEKLKSAAGRFFPSLAQGSVFAAKARHRAGLVTAETEAAVSVICNRDVKTAAGLSDNALTDLHPENGLTDWEIWRRRIQSHFR